jgi:two-component system response regulator YesN
MGRFLRGQSRVFFRILLLCILLVAAVTLIVSTYMYFNLENLITAQNSRFIQDSLEKVGNSAVFMTEWASNLAVQTLYDSDISMLMSMSNVEPNLLPVIMKRQYSLKQASPNIYSIYVYNGVTRMFYTESSSNYQIPRDRFFDTDILPYIDDNGKALHLKPIPRRLNFTLDGRQTDTEVYTYILYENPAQSSENSNVIVINISRQWMDNAIRSLDKNTAENLLIVNGAGSVVYGGGVLPMQTDLSGNRSIKEVLKTSEPKGYFIAGENADRQFITFVRGTGKEADWIYIYRLPATTLLKDLTHTRQAVVRFSIAMLFLGLAGSVFYAIYVFRPFRLLQSKLTELETTNRGHLAAEQQALLRTVLVDSTMELAELDEAMAACGLPCLAARPVQAALFILDHFNSFERQNNHDQRQTLRSAITQLVLKHAEPHGAAYAVQTERDCIALILNPPANTAADIVALARAVQADAQAALGLSLSVVTGASNPNWFSLQDSYNALRSALPKRVFLGHGCIIDISRKTQLSGYEYPVAKEKQMCQALLFRNAPDALQCFQDMLDVTRNYSGSVLQVTLLRVITAIMETVEKLNHDSGQNISCNFDTFIAQIGSHETLAELVGAFDGIFTSIVKQMNTGKTQSHKELVEKIVAAIHLRYPEWALTIDSFESMADLSGIHLTRLFRRFIGESFTDYLRRVRLQKAGELLAGTCEPVTKIAEMVGMMNVNHFSTLFKREYGLTPSEYRKHTPPTPL